MTIHQPRSDIFFICDYITLLSQGHVVYTGPTTDALAYFEQLGFVCPVHTNPADFLIDIASIDTTTTEASIESLQRVALLQANWANQQSKEHISPSEESILRIDNPVQIAWTRKSYILLKRNLLTGWRDPLGLITAVLESLLIGVILGWMFYKVPGDLTGIRSLQGFCWSVIALQAYLYLLFSVYRISEWDIKVFDRERLDGLYGVIPWLLSYRVSHLLTEDIIVPLLLSLVSYYMTQTSPTAADFGKFFVINLFNHFCCVTFALLCVAVSRNFAGAALMANIMFTVLSMSCGFFVQADTIPVWVRWLKYLAWTFWSFGGLAEIQFDQKFFDCPDGNPEAPVCIPYTGDFILSALGIGVNNFRNAVIVLTSMAIFFTLMAVIVLLIKRVHIGISKQVKPSSEIPTSGALDMIEKRVEPIMIKLQDVGLSVTNGLQRTRPKQLLNSVSTEFQPGCLNIILGPSGSGKSTLLNLLARRLHSSLVMNFQQSGNISYNGVEPTNSTIRSLTSYVEQEDGGLLPSLTVRETLRYAALLRLPRWMPKQQKIQKAEEVIAQTGLTHCADTLIGSEFIKGISGGEKRRVTIAIQILTDPKILLADEPTSGLDAWTARSLVKLLQKLALEGRTVVCSVHQSRSDIFGSFGNVLLLARGGDTLYSGGASGMLPYFDQIGYPCPSLMNPADFVLDLCSLDLQTSQKETITRVKIDKLVSFWKARNAEEALPTTGQQRLSSLPLRSLRRELAPFRTVYPLLVRRSVLNFSRQPNAMLARIMQVVSFGAILAIWFSRLGDDYTSIQNRFGFVQEISALIFIGMLNNISVFIDERNVFYREHQDRTYNVEPFFLSYLTIEILFEVVTSLFFALFLCIAGFPNTINSYFLVFWEALTVVNCGESIGIAFNTLFYHAGFAVNATSIVLSLFNLMAGGIALTMPPFFQGINYISVVKYGTGAVMVEMLTDFTFTCTDIQRLPNGECPVTTGEEALDIYGLDVDRNNYIVALGGKSSLYLCH